MTLTSSIVLAFAGRVAAAAAVVVFRFILALVLGPADQGVFYLFLQAALLIAAAGGLGLGQAAIYYMHREPAHAPGIAIGTFHLTAAWAIAAALVGAPVVMLLMPHRALDVPALALTAGVAAVAVALVQNGQSVLLGLHRSRWGILPAASVGVIHIILFIVLISAGLGALQSAIASFCGASAVAAAVYYLAAQSVVRGNRTGFGAVATRRMVFGFQYAVSSVLSLIVMRADLYVVSRRFGAGGAGCYSLAEMMSEIVWFVPDAIALMLLPQAALDNEAKLRERGPQAARAGLLLSATCAVLLAGIVTGCFLTPAANAYRPSLAPFLIMLPGVCAIASSKIIFTLLVARGDLMRGNLLLLASAALNAGLSWGVAPFWGSAGAAAASSVAGVLCALLMARRCGRILGCGMGELLVPRMEDARVCVSRLRSMIIHQQ